MKYLYKYFILCIIAFFGTRTGYAQVLINENFNADTSFPQGWMSPTLPAFTVTSTNSCDGNSVRGPLSSNSIAPELAYMSQIATGEDIIISFDYKILKNTAGNPATNEDFGKFDLQYSIDGGHSWITYYTINEATHTPSRNCTTLTHTIGSTDVPAGSDFGWRIKGQYSQGNNYIYIDDFTAIEQVDCLQPVNVVLENVTFDSIEISWTEFNTTPATAWEVAYCPEGVDPSNPACFLNNIVSVTSNPYTITGLQEGTNYDIYVRATCSSTDKSTWSEPIRVQTVALGTDCTSPLTITDLPYNHSSNTKIYDNNYSGNPGDSCSTAADFLEGNDVVYHYYSTQEDILQIELSGNLSGAVGVFVYEACSHIGSSCYAGAITDNGVSFMLSDIYVEGNKDYYIVISTSGLNTTTEYTLDINGFECTTWEAPAGKSNYEFSNQTLADYSETRIGVNPTIGEAILTWYSDAALSTQIKNLNNTVLNDNDQFWVTQTIMGCTSPALHITFNAFDCGELSVFDVNASSNICDEGTTTLTANARTDNLIWYDKVTGGEPIGIGKSFEIPEIKETTSFWVSEFFMGEAFLSRQANPGPVIDSSSDENAGVTFELTEPSLIMDVQVYVTGPSGDLTIRLEDKKGSIRTKIINVPGGSEDFPTLVTIPLDFEITDPTQGPFKLTKVAGPSMLITEASDTSFPYALGNIGKVTNGINLSSTSPNYYYFYNWTITSVIALCESERVKVEAVVNDTKPIKIDVAEYTVCLGNAVNLSVKSDDKDYHYTWEWEDSNGFRHTLTGNSINPIVEQGTKFTVLARNLNTGCSTQEEVFINMIGVGEVPTYSSTESICAGEIVELKAGQIRHTFEDTITDWTFNNYSSAAPGLSRDAAGWKQVSSPYALVNNATSNDNSNFMITMANPLGPGSIVHTEMISPPINLVGIQEASLEFYHYYRHHTTKRTTASVEISINGGRSWSTLKTFTTNQGSENNFKKVSIDLEPYFGLANVQFKFRYNGGWGWWWAIDNVSISQTYMNGEVVWNGKAIQNLYLDKEAKVNYQGQATNVVYFKGDESGVFEYNVDLLINNCSDSVSNKVAIEVNKIDKPQGDTVQEFAVGSKVANIDVKGSSLMFYRLIDGEYVRQSINATLINNETYYISQRVGNCTSEFLEVNVSYVCPDPSDLNITVDLTQDGTASTAIVFWELPENTLGLEGYQLYLKNEQGEIIEDIYLSGKQNYQIIEALPLDESFTVELYSVCDTQNNIFGNTLEAVFSTANLNKTKFKSLDFKYYPNPILDILYVNSSQLINDITIYSYDGKLVYSINNIMSKDTTIDLSGLATGTYLLVATSSSKSKMVRLIKK